MRTYALCCLAAVGYVVVLLMVLRDIVSGIITAGVLAVASVCGLALWHRRRAKRTGKVSQ